MSSHQHQHAHSHGHAHPHDHAPGHHDHDHHSISVDSKHRGKLLIAIAITLSFMLLEFVGGTMAGSLALIADAGHMMTDAAALTLAWLAIRIAERPADHRRTFGYQRLRVLATFVNGVALLVIVGWISLEAIDRLLDPQPVDAWPMLWIALLGALANVTVFLILRSSSAHDMNMSAATLHVIGDMIGSIAAVMAAGIILTTGWLAADPLLSLVVCVLIVRSAWSLVKRSTHILLEGSPDWLDVNELRRVLEREIPAIRNVHHVHCWLAGPHETLLTMHAEVVAGADHAMVLRESKRVLAQTFGITHATIQVETAGCLDNDC